MKIYTLPDGTQVTATGQFQIGNQKYPPGWLQTASDAEITGAGIIVQIVADPPPPPPAPTGPAAVQDTYVASLKRKAMQLKKKGDISGSVDLLLKASGIGK